jgi:hypothetical protein
MLPLLMQHCPVRTRCLAWCLAHCHTLPSVLSPAPLPCSASVAPAPRLNVLLLSVAERHANSLQVAGNSANEGDWASPLTSWDHGVGLPLLPLHHHPARPDVADLSTCCVFPNSCGCSARAPHLLRVLPMEGWPATEEDVEDDATGPDVRLLAILPPQHLCTQVGTLPGEGGKNPQTGTA